MTTNQPSHTPADVMRRLNELKSVMKDGEELATAFDAEMRKLADMLTAWASSPTKTLYWAGEKKAVGSIVRLIRELEMRYPGHLHRIRENRFLEPSKIMVVDNPALGEVSE